MRLIDADELKKAINDNDYASACNNFFGNLLFKIIDNAPTVEAIEKSYYKPICEVKFDEEQLKEIVEKAKQEVLASVERPQGEWIECTPTEYYPEPNCICSLCNFGNDSKSKFCPNCGAEMKHE